MVEERWSELDVAAKVERLRETMLHLTKAAVIINDAVKELHDHTDEHHVAINKLGHAVGLLEELMIGGGDAPTS